MKMYVNENIQKRLYSLRLGSLSILTFFYFIVMVRLHCLHLILFLYRYLIY